MVRVFHFKINLLLFNVLQAFGYFLYQRLTLWILYIGLNSLPFDAHVLLCSFFFNFYRCRRFGNHHRCSQTTHSRNIRYTRHRDVTAKLTIGEMIIPNDRYTMHETENSMYAVQMTLTIKFLQKPDFGGYRCISKNSIGGIEATIRLYGKLWIWKSSTLTKITKCEMDQ